MDSIRSTIFLPFRPSSVSDNEIKRLSICDASGRLWSRFSQAQMASVILLNAAPGAGLKAADIETLGDLVSYNKNDLLKFRNFGKKSLTELEDLVDNKGLSFGMNVAKYKLDKE